MRGSAPCEDRHNIVQHVYWIPLTSFATTLVLTAWLLRSRFSALVIDRPNRRSLHEVPVPRTGGIAIHAGIVLAAANVAPDIPAAAWIAYALALAVSLVDDLRGLPVAARLAAHLATAGLFSFAVLPAQAGWMMAAVVALAVAWMSNLYNFMDGSDGLAGGMALFGFSFYGAAAVLSGSTDFALINFSIGAAAAAFLVFNFHPARIFMGDAGSVPLGFLAAALGTMGWLRNDWPWWFPPLVFSPFIADASVTLARRLLAGEKVWQAHRDHYYQRLVQLGWGHRATALAEYALMGACGAVGLAALVAPAALQAALLGACGAAYAVLMALIGRAWRRHAAAGCDTAR
jgi:UDP-N-acetylmuramyl pentapeptide phosphotransferase/UDP-N-acetylglucosamine-1-phosphate transferase